MSSYDETASPDRDPLSPAPEEAPDTVQETAPVLQYRKSK